MTAFARGTDVTPERSKAELARILSAHGADNVCIGESREKKTILLQFSYKAIPCQLRLPLPDLKEERFQKNARGYRRARGAAESAHDAEVRRLWRVLVLTVKARFEEIDSLIFTPEQALVSWMLLPDGTTIHDRATESVKKFLATGKAPGVLMLNLPAPAGPKEKP